MKKFTPILLMISILFFGFSNFASADNMDYNIGLNPTLPFTINGHTYSDVAINGDAENPGDVLFFNPSDISNIVQAWMPTYPSYLNFYASHGAYFYGCEAGMVGCIQLNNYMDRSGTYNGFYVMSSSWNFGGIFTPNLTPAPRLTIEINPLAGGNVTGSSISCNVDTSSICQYAIGQGNQVSLTANANCDWAFGSWDNGSTITNNPYTFNMPSGNQTLYAKFFKTFTNRVGNFQASIGSKIDTGQCVPYVRYETDIPIYGDAYTWYGQAVSANYATSTTVPRVGSIIVFAIQGGMASGHVGIVTSINGNNLGIRSQNWHNDEKVSDDTINVSGYTITGYIYYTP